MRWSIIRLIWVRELRDQLRDRRTLFMIAVLPVLVYPVAGVGLTQLAVGFLQQPQVIGVQGIDNLPEWQPVFDPAVGAANWVTFPVGPGGVEQLASATARSLARRSLDPPLLVPDGPDRYRIAPAYLEAPGDDLLLRIVDLGDPPDTLPADPDEAFAAIDRTKLLGRQVDLLVVVGPDFARRVAAGERPPLWVIDREGDDRSRLLNTRFLGALARYKRHLKEARLLRAGLPSQFDDAFEVRDRELARPSSRRVQQDLFDVTVRIFPFVLVMWSLAGALYPAVDLCAGEKERGTMETLLISPASREEIVYGKFLTIWVFSAATALLNLLSMGLTTWHLAGRLAGDSFQLGGLLWGVVLLLPLSAFFSALCLAVGAYARSSKEGQYYLMPLFLITMPLIFLTLAPSVTLNPFYSMVPVTGVALLLQKLMAAGTPDRELWLYFIPVLVPMAVYGWLALRWAVEQFQREEVLFREAERLDVGLWLKHLFRDKEALPSGGEALFCFGLILAGRWLAYGVGGDLPTLVHTAVTQLAFVGTPVLVMTLLLTTRPRQALNLRWPPWWGWLSAAALAALLIYPMIELSLLILRQFPVIKELMEKGMPLTAELQRLLDQLHAGASPALSERLLYVAALGVVPAVCEELAFRGFLLSGLSRRVGPVRAVLLTSFLFAVYHMNVFQFLPAFLMGVVLGLLVWRTGSVGPAILFHFLFNVPAFGPAVAPELFGFGTDVATAEIAWAVPAIVRPLLALGCVTLAVGLLILLVVSPSRPSGAEDATTNGRTASPTEGLIAAGPVRSRRSLSR